MKTLEQQILTLAIEQPGIMQTEIAQTLKKKGSAIKTAVSQLKDDCLVQARRTDKGVEVRPTAIALPVNQLCLPMNRAAEAFA